MSKKDEEYMLDLVLKDQALRTMKLIIDSNPDSKRMCEVMEEVGASEEEALLSVMRYQEESLKAMQEFNKLNGGNESEK